MPIFRDLSSSGWQNRLLYPIPLVHAHGVTYIMIVRGCKWGVYVVSWIAWSASEVVDLHVEYLLICWGWIILWSKNDDRATFIWRDRSKSAACWLSPAVGQPSSSSPLPKKDAQSDKSDLVHSKYFGEKLHIDQNEKPVMFGVTHVCAVDGHNGRIVGFVTMPIKNITVYECLYMWIVV